MKHHVFGPVPSRRLGRSLGVDLIPHKTCSYDCIYCQIGTTTRKTIERKEWVPLEEVVEQIRGKLSAEPDYITCSGSGEPTLYSRLGELIDRIKAMTSIPVAVLTNGSLLWMPEVRRDLARADLVVPSLDAPDEGLFHYVNRPHPSLHFDQMLEGLVTFRDEFKGQLWLEVFLLAGVTGLEPEVKRLAEHVRRIRPDRVQINTVVRPPAEEYAHPLSPEDLESFANLFGGNAEVIAGRTTTQARRCACAAKLDDVLDIIARRPCTVEDIVAGLEIPPLEALKHVERLVDEGRIESESRDNLVYYKTRY